MKLNKGNQQRNSTEVKEFPEKINKFAKTLDEPTQTRERGNKLLISEMKDEASLQISLPLKG